MGIEVLGGIGELRERMLGHHGGLSGEVPLEDRRVLIEGDLDGAGG